MILSMLYQRKFDMGGINIYIFTNTSSNLLILH
jgi:hypothetical protein